MAEAIHDDFVREMSDSYTARTYMNDYALEQGRREVLYNQNLRLAEDYVRMLEEARLRPPPRQEAELLKRNLDDFFLSTRNQYVLQWRVPSTGTPRLKRFVQSVERGLGEQMKLDVLHGLYSKRPMTDLEFHLRDLENELIMNELRKRKASDLHRLLALDEEKVRLIHQLNDVERELKAQPPRGFYDYVRPRYDMFARGSLA